MTYARWALITSRKRVYVEADDPGDAQTRFNTGTFDAEGGEVVAWEPDGEWEEVDARDNA